MNWLATTESIPVLSPSNAKFVREVSPGPTTWRSTWRDTCQNIWKTDTTSTVFLSLVTSQTSLKWTHLFITLYAGTRVIPCSKKTRRKRLCFNVLKCFSTNLNNAIKTLCLEMRNWTEIFFVVHFSLERRI